LTPDRRQHLRPAHVCCCANTGVVEEIGMARWRQPGAQEMLQAFLLLKVVAFLSGLLPRPHNQ
jgi:hypothetical protein